MSVHREKGKRKEEGERKPTEKGKRKGKKEGIQEIRDLRANKRSQYSLTSPQYLLH